VGGCVRQFDPRRGGVDQGTALRDLGPKADRRPAQRLEGRQIVEGGGGFPDDHRCVPGAIPQGVDRGPQADFVPIDVEQPGSCAGDFRLDLDHALADADARGVPCPGQLLVVFQRRRVGLDDRPLTLEILEFEVKGTRPRHQPQPLGLDPGPRGGGVEEGRLLPEIKFALAGQLLGEGRRGLLWPDAGLGFEQKQRRRQSRVGQGPDAGRILLRRPRPCSQNRQFGVAVEDVGGEQTKRFVLNRPDDDLGRSSLRRRSFLCRDRRSDGRDQNEKSEIALHDDSP